VTGTPAGTVSVCADAVPVPGGQSKEGNQDMSKPDGSENGKQEERRYKLFAARRSDVLSTVTNGARYQTNDVILMQRLQIPDGAAVVAVHYDYARDAFVFLLSHPDFEPVAEGAEIPFTPGLARSVRYAVVLTHHMMLELAADLIAKALAGQVDHAAAAEWLDDCRKLLKYTHGLRAELMEELPKAAEPIRRGDRLEWGLDGKVYRAREETPRDQTAVVIAPPDVEPCNIARGDQVKP